MQLALPLLGLNAYAYYGRVLLLPYDIPLVLRTFATRPYIYQQGVAPRNRSDISPADSTVAFQLPYALTTIVRSTKQRL